MKFQFLILVSVLALAVDARYGLDLTETEKNDFEAVLSDLHDQLIPNLRIIELLGRVAVDEQFYNEFTDLFDVVTSDIPLAERKAHVYAKFSELRDVIAASEPQFSFDSTDDIEALNSAINYIGEQLIEELRIFEFFTALAQVPGFSNSFFDFFEAVGHSAEPKPLIVEFFGNLAETIERNHTFSFEFSDSQKEELGQLLEGIFDELFGEDRRIYDVIEWLEIDPSFRHDSIDFTLRCVMGPAEKRRPALLNGLRAFLDTLVEPNDADENGPEGSGFVTSEA